MDPRKRGHAEHRKQPSGKTFEPLLYSLVYQLDSCCRRPVADPTQNTFYYVQIARAKQIKSHFLQKTATEHSDARKANEESAKGVIVSLGLIKGEEGEDK